MNFSRETLTSPMGQAVLVAGILGLGVIAVRWQHAPASLPALPAAKVAPTVPLPKTLTREGVRVPKPAAPAMTVAAPSAAPMSVTSVVTHVPPLLLFSAPREVPPPSRPPTAPYGRMIPCETVVALESNRLDTPIIALVTEDVWHDGQCVIPAGAEVHGRAALDRARERLGAQANWRIVWRTRDSANGSELAVNGLVLDREYDAASRTWGARDGSAGLRGEVVKTDNERELKLFAASFLASATSALQDSRPTAGLLGESSVPVATARNAVLSGTGAVLREYAQSMRDAIAHDGFYLRVPAGKPFYLYVTETLVRPVTAATQPSAQP